MSFGPDGPLLGSGGFYSPQGPRGPWIGCGCSSILMILGGMILVMSGCLRLLGQ